jgi:Uma2 family endonuclease
LFSREEILDELAEKEKSAAEFKLGHYRAGAFLDTILRRFYGFRMLAPVQPAITRADYEAVAEGPPYYQLIEGQLIMSPSPFTYHQRIVGRIYGVLSYWVRENALGEVFVSPLDVYLNDINVYQPDVVFISNARLGQVTEKGIEGAPDLCVEVLSKSTQRFDKITKKKIFAQAGLKHYWLVDGEAKSITAFDLSADTEKAAQVVTAPEVFSPALFPGLEIRLDELFQAR